MCPDEAESERETGNKHGLLGRESVGKEGQLLGVEMEVGKGNIREEEKMGDTQGKEEKKDEKWKDTVEELEAGTQLIQLGNTEDNQLNKEWEVIVKEDPLTGELVTFCISKLKAKRIHNTPHTPLKTYTEKREML